MNSKEHSPFLVALAIGLAGGTARYLDDVAHHGRKFAFSAFLIAMFVAMFFGWLAFSFVVSAGYVRFAPAAGGLGGFMGTQTLDLGLGILRKKLHIDSPPEALKEPPK